jgi:hypothetical protein
MRPLSIAVVLASLMFPASALAGPEGTFHVQGVDPEDGNDYTGSVEVIRQGEAYKVIWKIDGEVTNGVGLGLRLIDGRMVAGPASDQDTGIAISYLSDDAPGNAIYTEFSDGTWHGVWAYEGHNKVSFEEWIPTVRQIKVKSLDTVQRKDKQETTAVQATAVSDVEANVVPARRLSSPLPANASPKS